MIMDGEEGRECIRCGLPRYDMVVSQVDETIICEPCAFIENSRESAKFWCAICHSPDYYAYKDPDSDDGRNICTRCRQMIGYRYRLHTGIWAMDIKAGDYL
jgi:hypothetical protein